VRGLDDGVDVLIVCPCSEAQSCQVNAALAVRSGPFRSRPSLAGHPAFFSRRAPLNFFFAAVFFRSTCRCSCRAWSRCLRLWSCCEAGCASGWRLSGHCLRLVCSN
jgi:hypothetical protein